MATTLELSPAVDVTERIVDAALGCVARSGLTKLTVENVAREAGISRATVYRMFPSKAALVAAAIRSEADRITRAIDIAASGAGDLDDAVVRVLQAGLREMRASAALTFIAEHEPHLLHPHLEFAGGDRFLFAMGRRLESVLAPWCAAPQRGGEWIARIGLCLWRSPVPLVDVTDGDALARFVSTYVSPGLAPATRAYREEE